MNSDIRQALFQVNRQTEEIMDMVIRAEGLTPLESMVLTYLSRHGQMTLGELTAHCRFNQGNASMLCKRMEKKGLIRRERCGDDERVVRLSLAEAGTASAKRIQENGELLYAYIEREASKRGVELESIWMLMTEISLAAIDAYRRDRDRTEEK